MLPLLLAATLSICTGTHHQSRYAGNGVHVGCATGYDIASSSQFTACPSPYGRLDDSKLTIALSPRYTSKVPCGSLIKVCYVKCAIVTRTDVGPYDPNGSVCGSWSIPDCNRDMDMSHATALAIGRNPLVWADPSIIYWKVIKYAR